MTNRSNFFIIDTVANRIPHTIKGAKKLVLLSVLLCMGIAVYSQGKQWTLEECINYALENNIQVKQQQLNAEYSVNTLFQSKAAILPDINASASQNYSFGRSVDPFTNEFSLDNTKTGNLSLNGSLVLFNGLQQYNTIRQNEFNLKAGLQDVEKIKNSIAMNIALAYLQILLNMELLDIAKNQVGITQQQVERTRKLVDAGSLAHGSLLEIQSQEASEELSVVSAQNQLDISLLTLTQLLDLDSVTGFDIAQPVFPDITAEPYPFSVSQIYAASLNLPQIKSAEYQLESQKKGLQIAKGMRSPRLILGGSIGTGYSDARKKYDYEYGGLQQTGFLGTDTTQKVYAPFMKTIAMNYPYGDQLKDNQNKSLYLSLSIPIFNGWQTNTTISNSKISVLNSDYNLQFAKNQLYKEIQQANADAGASMNKFLATKKALVSMEEAFRYTDQKFNVGLVTSVDYNLAKNNLTRTGSQLLQAKYEYIFKIKVLDFYRGVPIKL